MGNQAVIEIKAGTSPESCHEYAQNGKYAKYADYTMCRLICIKCAVCNKHGM
jgi:hypothetical protein